MKYFLILAFQFAALFSFAQPSWAWAESGGGAGNDQAFSVASDAAGNSYATGTFRDTATFGAFTLISAGATDVYVVKYDPNGNCLWAKRGGCASTLNEDEGRGIDVDGAGNVYVTGTFYDTTSFGNLTLIALYGHSEMFLVKYDTNGNEIWAKQVSGVVAGTTGADVATDANGNSYVTGFLSGGSCTFGSFILTESGFYVAKYNSAGTVIWATGIGSNYGFRATSIGIDPFGEAYIAGDFQGSETIGSQTYSSTSANDLFIAKFSAAGNFIWLKRAGGTGSDYSHCRSVGVDGNGNPFITGDLEGSLTIGSTTLNVLTPPGGSEIFIAKFDSTGNPIWANQSRNIANVLPHNTGNDIATDAAGYSYVTGNIYGKAVFNSDTIFPISGGYSGYVIKYDPAGNPIWTKDFYGGSSISKGVCINGFGACFVTGFSKAPVIFDSYHTTFFGSEDVFVARLDEDEFSTIHENANPFQLTVFEDQSADFLNISIGENDFSKGNTWFSLCDLSGREVKRIRMISSSSQIGTGELAPGIYVWKISSAESQYDCGKIFIQ